MIAEGQSLSSLSDDKFNKVQKKERLSFCIMLGTSFKTYLLEHWANIFVHYVYVLHSNVHQITLYYCT